jgi:hypothetical protein
VEHQWKSLWKTNASASGVTTNLPAPVLADIFTAETDVPVPGDASRRRAGVARGERPPYPHGRSRTAELSS